MTWLRAVSEVNLREQVERFIQTHKFEGLDKFVIVAERHLNHVNREWRLHYNRERPHEARGHLPPEMEKPPEANETVRLNDGVYSSRLDGRRHEGPDIHAPHLRRTTAAAVTRE